MLDLLYDGLKKEILEVGSSNIDFALTVHIDDINKLPEVSKKLQFGRISTEYHNGKAKGFGVKVKDSLKKYR